MMRRMMMVMMVELTPRPLSAKASYLPSSSLLTPTICKEPPSTRRNLPSPVGTVCRPFLQYTSGLGW